MRVNRTCWMVGVTIVFGAALFYLFGSRASSRSQADPVVVAIQQLSAGSPDARNAAKQRIIQIGAPAIPDLILFLQDLLSHPRNRYATGTTDEDFEEAMKRARSIPDSDLTGKAEAARQLSNILINQRLEEDVCELLGRLQAEEAIPVLVEAMEKWPGGDSWENMNPAMNALVTIGPPAVAAVIEAIESSRERVAATPYAEGQPSNFFISTEAAKSQARGTLVLGEIGDPRALPTLERLENSTDSPWLVSYLRRAISKIREKHN